MNIDVNGFLKIVYYLAVREMSMNISLYSCRKIYVERDYSNGTGIAFATSFPSQLAGMIEPGEFEDTVIAINSLFYEVADVRWVSVVETVTSCFSCYLNRLCSQTLYDKQLERITKFIDGKNKSLFIPHGLYVTDPRETGFRMLEISMLTTGKVLDAPKAGESLSTIGEMRMTTSARAEEERNGSTPASLPVRATTDNSGAHQ